MVRLDNAFFASLAGGLPKIVTRLERGPDLVLHFTDLVLTAPDIRITGSGIRRRDGSFHFEGRGVQRSYGPFTLVLDGPIDHPTLRSEERRVGDECVRTCRSRGSPDH